MTLSLKHTQQDADNMYYAYVTRDDLTDCFGDSVVLTLRNFDYYETSACEAEERSAGTPETLSINQLKVVSYNTSIDVRLVTDEGSVFSKEALAAEQLVKQSMLLFDWFFVLITKCIFFRARTTQPRRTKRLATSRTGEQLNEPFHPIAFPLRFCKMIRTTRPNALDFYSPRPF